MPLSKEEAQKRGYKIKDIKHSMNRRADWNDYFMPDWQSQPERAVGGDGTGVEFECSRVQRFKPTVKRKM